MQWMQIRPTKNIPPVPMARPAFLKAKGIASIPVPTFPLIICIMVAALDVREDALGSRGIRLMFLLSFNFFCATGEKKEKSGLLVTGQVVKVKCHSFEVDVVPLDLCN